MSAQDGIYFDEPVDVGRWQEITDRRRFVAVGEFVQLRLVNEGGALRVSEIEVEAKGQLGRYGKL